MKTVFHLDLKGVPPTEEGLLRLPKIVRSLGYDSILVEWEGMYPWKVDPLFRSPMAYSRSTIRGFFDNLVTEGLSYIPLVQSLGHLENVLVHECYADLREDPQRCDTIRPLSARAGSLIQAMIQDVLSEGPNPEYIHLGGDEAWALGRHPESQAYIAGHADEVRGKAKLYMAHVAPLLQHVRSVGSCPILWSDMMEQWPDDVLAELAALSHLMPWGYVDEAGGETGHNSRQLLERYRAAGVTLWGATAFGGADGYSADLPIIEERIRNASSWYRLHKEYGFVGMIATGWTRYNSHRLQVCPLDACWDAVAATALCLSGAEPSTDTIHTLMDQAEVASRFQRLREKFAPWSDAVSEAWLYIRYADEQRAAEMAEPHRRGSGALGDGLDLLKDRVREAVQKSKDVCEVLKESTSPQAANEYIADRVRPLQYHLKRLTGPVAVHPNINATIPPALRRGRTRSNAASVNI